MDKQVVVHPYNEILFCNKNKIPTHTTIWMNLKKKNNTPLPSSVLEH